MEKIQSGKYVELGYDLYQFEPDGSEKLVHQTIPTDPERIVFGVTPGVIEPLARAIEGLAPGDSFDVTAKSSEAFGSYDPKQVITLNKDIFLNADGKFDSEIVAVGKYVPMMTAEGYHINGLVRAITDDSVKMDFNHPLAGKDLRFKGKIITVRDATPEELNPHHGCGCGCDHDHDHCGGCDDGSCGGGHCHC